MKRLLLFLLLFISNLIFAQQPRKLDSLKAVLAKLPAKGKSFVGDTTRVRLLCEIGELIIQMDSSIIYFNQSIVIAQKRDFYTGLSRGFNGKAYRLKNQKKYLLAQEMFYKASFYAEKAKDYMQLGKSYQGIADVNLISMQHSKALSFYEKTISIYEKIKNFRGILVCNNNKAIVYNNIGNKDQAIKLYNKCLILNKIYKVEGFDGHIYNNLAFFYQNLKNYPEALRNVRKAIEIYSKSGEFYKIYMASTYIIWAEIAFLNSDLTNAEKYAHIALKLNHGSGVNNDVKIYDTFTFYF